MRCKIGILGALLLLVLLRTPVALAVPQDAPDKSKKDDAAKTDEKKKDSTVSVQIKISAEEKSSLPSGSNIQWKTSDDTCKHAEGQQPIGAGGTVSLKLPVCKIKILIIITSFTTQEVTVDMVGNKEKYKDPIFITVKHQGPPMVKW